VRQSGWLALLFLAIACHELKTLSVSDRQHSSPVSYMEAETQHVRHWSGFESLPSSPSAATFFLPFKQNRNIWSRGSLPFLAVAESEECQCMDFAEYHHSWQQ
jgi:hypothetical protein